MANVTFLDAPNPAPAPVPIPLPTRRVYRSPYTCTSDGIFVLSVFIAVVVLTAVIWIAATAVTKPKGGPDL